MGVLTQVESYNNVFEKKAEKYKKKVQELKAHNLKKEQEQEKKLENYERLLVNYSPRSLIDILFSRLRSRRSSRTSKPNLTRTSSRKPTRSAS